MSLLGDVDTAPSAAHAPHPSYDTPKPPPEDEANDVTDTPEDSHPKSEPLTIATHPGVPDVTTGNPKDLVADLCKIIERQSAEIASLRKQQSQVQKSATPGDEVSDEGEDEYYGSRTPSPNGDESPGPEPHPDDVDSESTNSMHDGGDDDKLAARSANPLFSCGLAVRRRPEEGREGREGIRRGRRAGGQAGGATGQVCAHPPNLSATPSRQNFSRVPVPGSGAGADGRCG